MKSSKKGDLYSKLFVMSEKKLLKKHLVEAARWIAITKEGVVLIKVKRDIDDFYRVCLYLLGKAISKVLGIVDNESISFDDVSNISIKEDPKLVIVKLLSDNFAVYVGNNRYVINYLNLDAIFEEVREYIRRIEGEIA